MTNTQILILIKFLLDRDNSILRFSWSNTDQNLHLRFIDKEGDVFHKVFNQQGHEIDWEE